MIGEWRRTFVEVQRMTKAQLLEYVREVERIAAKFQEQLTKETPFYLVWRDGSRRGWGDTIPQYRHWSKTMADMEAEQLARLNPGERFYVLPVNAYAIAEVQVTFKTAAEDEREEVPF